MMTLFLIVVLAALLAALAFAHRTGLRAYVTQCHADSAARLDRTGARTERWCRSWAEQAREAFFGPRERRWHGWGAWFRSTFRSRKDAAGGTAPAAVPAPRSHSVSGAFTRLGSLVLISAAGVANVFVEVVLVALTFAEYLGPLEAYPPFLARFFAAPSLLIAVAVLAGMTVWGVITMESIGFEEPSFDTRWASVLSPAFLVLGIYVVAKAGEVRGLVSLPTANDARAFQVMQAAGNAKLEISIAVAVLAAGTSVIGILALTRLFAVMGVTAAAAAVVILAMAGYAFGLVRYFAVRAVLLPIALFLDLVGVPRVPFPPPPAPVPQQSSIHP